MFKVEHLSDSLLKRFAMELPKGQFLFKQGDKGNTLFILIEGEVELYHKTLATERMVGVLGEGEIIGERALLSATPYKRHFSAVARTEATVLQFDHQALKLITANMPDFTSKLLGLVIERLERANAMVAMLQLQSPIERAVVYMQFLAEHSGKKTPGGTEVFFRVAEASTYTNVEPTILKEVVDELTATKLVIAAPGDKLIVPDADALLSFVPSLKEKIAA